MATIPRWRTCFYVDAGRCKRLVNRSSAPDGAIRNLWDAELAGKFCAEDLALVGRYLFGPRWQTQLARALHRTPRLVRYWAAGRLVPRHACERIAALMLQKQESRLRFDSSNFLYVVAGLKDREMKEQLLGMGTPLGFTIDNQLRRAAILGHPPPPPAHPSPDFAPHNKIAKKPLKSTPVVVVPLTPVVVPLSASVGLVDPLELSSSTALPSAAAGG